MEKSSSDNTSTDNTIVETRVRLPDFKQAFSGSAREDQSQIFLTQAPALIPRSSDKVDASVGDHSLTGNTPHRLLPNQTGARGSSEASLIPGSTRPSLPITVVQLLQSDGTQPETSQSPATSGSIREALFRKLKAKETLTASQSVTATPGQSAQICLGAESESANAIPQEPAVSSAPTESSGGIAALSASPASAASLPGGRPNLGADLTSMSQHELQSLRATQHLQSIAAAAASSGAGPPPPALAPPPQQTSPQAGSGTSEEKQPTRHRRKPLQEQIRKIVPLGTSPGPTPATFTALTVSKTEDATEPKQTVTSSHSQSTPDKQREPETLTSDTVLERVENTEESQKDLATSSTAPRSQPADPLQHPDPTSSPPSKTPRSDKDEHPLNAAPPPDAEDVACLGSVETRPSGLKLLVPPKEKSEAFPKPFRRKSITNEGPLSVAPSVPQENGVASTFVAVPAGLSHPSNGQTPVQDVASFAAREDNFTFPFEKK